MKLSRKAQWIPGQGRGSAVDMKYLGPISLVGEVLGAVRGQNNSRAAVRGDRPQSGAIVSKPK